MSGGVSSGGTLRGGRGGVSRAPFPRRGGRVQPEQPPTGSAPKGPPTAVAAGAGRNAPSPTQRRKPGPKKGSYRALDPVTGDRVSAEMAEMIDAGWPAETVYGQYKQYGAPKTLRGWISRFRARQGR